MIINDFLIEAQPRYCEDSTFTSTELCVMNWLWLNQLETELGYWCSTHRNATNAEIQAEAKRLQDLIEIETTEFPDPIAAEVLKISKENGPIYKDTLTLAKLRVEARLRAGREMLSCQQVN